VPYAGEGFALLLPSKWNPSKEKDFKGQVDTELRYGGVNNKRPLKRVFSVLMKCNTKLHCVLAESTSTRLIWPHPRPTWLHLDNS